MLARLRMEGYTGFIRAYRGLGKVSGSRRVSGFG